MSDFYAFRTSFRGDVVTPADPDYDVAISRWAKNAARKAKVVAFPKDAQDVARAIAYARRADLTIAIRGGGHNPHGASSSDGGLVVDLSRHLNQVRVDPAVKLAYVDGGSLWATVDKAAIEHGLASVAGTVNHTGVGGLLLGGGYGWLSGSHGLVIDNLVEATVVIADGSILTASDTQNSDLFWAIRGGGSNFGVATEFVLKLHAQRRTVFAGAAKFSPDVSERLFDVTQAWWENNPSEKSSVMQVFMRGPDRNPHITCFLFYNGSEAEGRKAFDNFFALKPFEDTCSEIPYEEVNAMMNPLTNPGQNAYQKGVFQPVPFPRAVLPTLFEKFLQLSTSEQHRIGLFFEYFPLGAVNRVPDDATAARRGLSPNVFTLIFYDEHTPEQFAYTQHAARTLLDAQMRVSGGDTTSRKVGYGNYNADSEILPSDGVDKARGFFGSNYPRLQTIKKKYDPDLVFRRWYAITPSA